MKKLFYKSNMVDENGKAMGWDIDGKRFEDIKQIATKLFIKGYHTGFEKHYSAYWKEAEMYVAFCADQEDIYWAEIMKIRDTKRRLAKERAELLNKKPNEFAPRKDVK